jgi:hypothetical protein
MHAGLHASFIFSTAWIAEIEEVEALGSEEGGDEKKPRTARFGVVRGR